MRLMFAAAGTLCAAGLLVGCGSAAGYSDNASSAVRNMVSALKKYDAYRSGSVADTGAACHTGLKELDGNTALLDKSPPDPYKKVGVALNHAFKAARAGFSDCAGGAAAFDYVRMAQADTEISDANAWIIRARALDR
jgi:hypothetical protein